MAKRARPKPTQEELEAELWEQFLEEFKAEFVPDGKLDRIENMLNETDRGYVLAMCSNFDRLLRAMLESHFQRLSKGQEKLHTSLLNVTLKGLAIRHDLCCALNLIGRETRDGISLMRTVRIDCAHEEIFKAITSDHVNGVRGACPTFAKKVKPSNSLSRTAQAHPELKLSPQRVRLMDIATHLHAILANSLVAIRSDLPFPRV